MSAGTWRRIASTMDHGAHTKKLTVTTAGLDPLVGATGSVGKTIKLVLQP